MMETEYLEKKDYKKLQELFTLDKNTGNSILLLGASKAGKTTCLMYLFDNLFSKKQNTCKTGYIPVLFSGNKHANIYKDPVMKNVEKCDKFTKESETLIYQCQKINKENNNDFNFLFILDDIIKINKSQIVSNLILTLRNSNISSIISLQYPKLFSPGCRGNVNNILFRIIPTSEISSLPDSIFRSTIRMPMTPFFLRCLPSVGTPL